MIVVVVAILWKGNELLSRFSAGGGLLENLTNSISIPGIVEAKKLKGEEEGRINTLVLGMRGKGVVGGGLLADTIMVVSVRPSDRKVSMISIPRDLYVSLPEGGGKQKINAVYFYGYRKGAGMEDTVAPVAQDISAVSAGTGATAVDGAVSTVSTIDPETATIDTKKNPIAEQMAMEWMKQVVEEVSGIPIHYVFTINFAGFAQVIDALGGVDLHLKKPFVEPVQFQKAMVCDGHKGGVFTVPTGKYDIKKNEKGKIVAQYPLCYNKNNECGGVFTVPAGDVTLSGEQALCYVRARYTSSDFDRARRQQEVIESLKKKFFSVETVTDFGKINDIITAVGDNFYTTMAGWEMKRAYNIYSEIEKQGGINGGIINFVLQNSEDGLLYHPTESNGAGYILLPRGGNYDQIHNKFSTIFDTQEVEQKEAEVICDQETRCPDEQKCYKLPTAQKAVCMAVDPCESAALICDAPKKCIIQQQIIRTSVNTAAKSATSTTAVKTTTTAGNTNTTTATTTATTQTQTKKTYPVYNALCK